MDKFASQNVYSDFLPNANNFFEIPPIFLTFIGICAIENILCLVEDAYSKPINTTFGNISCEMYILGLLFLSSKVRDDE